MFQMQQSCAGQRQAAYSMLTRLVQPYLDMLEAHLILAQGALSIGDVTPSAKRTRRWPSSPIPNWPLTKAQVAGRRSGRQGAGRLPAKNPDAAKCAAPTLRWSNKSSSKRRASSSCCC
jgi:hypothetical protein